VRTVQQIESASLADWSARFNALFAWREREVNVMRDTTVVLHGRAQGIAPNGALRVLTAAGERLVQIGELSLRVRT
jgi:biotin-(acetyl-CoA carboxylase) ligase